MLCIIVLTRVRLVLKNYTSCQLISPLLKPLFTGLEKKQFCLQFTQKNPRGISFGSRFFLPVRVQGKADPITSIVVSEHVLVHQGNNSDNEPQ